MIWNIKSLVDRLKEGVKEAVETAIEERLTNTKDMQRRESVVAERETTWKDQLYRREVPSSRLSLSLKTFFYKFKFFYVLHPKPKLNFLILQIYTLIHE